MLKWMVLLYTAKLVTHAYLNSSVKMNIRSEGQEITPHNTHGSGMFTCSSHVFWCFRSIACAVVK